MRRTKAFIVGSPNSEPAAPRKPPPKPGVPATPTHTPSTSIVVPLAVEHGGAGSLDDLAHLVGGVALVVVVAEHGDDREPVSVAQLARRAPRPRRGCRRRVRSPASSSTSASSRSRSGGPRTGPESSPTWTSPTAATRTTDVIRAASSSSGGSLVGTTSTSLRIVRARRLLGDDGLDGVTTVRRRHRAGDVDAVLVGHVDVEVLLAHPCVGEQRLVEVPGEVAVLGIRPRAHRHLAERDRRELAHHGVGHGEVGRLGVEQQAEHRRGPRRARISR